MRLVSTLLVAVVAFCFVGMARGDDDAKKSKKPTAGVVEKVDTETKAITIKMGRKKDPNATTTTINFTDDTKFYLRNADGTQTEAKASDVTAGKRVQIVKETKDGKEFATKVTIVERKK